MGFAVEDEGGFGGGLAEGLGVQWRTEVRSVCSMRKAEVALGDRGPAMPVPRCSEADAVAEAHLARAAARPGAPMWWSERICPPELSWWRCPASCLSAAKSGRLSASRGTSTSEMVEPAFLNSGTEREAGFSGSEGEGDEGRRDVEIVEGAGHRVLAADGGEAQRVLGVEGA